VARRVATGPGLAAGGAILDLTTAMEAMFAGDPGRSADRPPGSAVKIPRPAMKRSPLRVLVTDDEALIRWSVVQTLADLGIEVTQADDGRSTLAAIDHAEQPFDVVVLDLRLPDVDDLSLLAAIRRANTATAVVLMTAFGTADIVAQAHALGVRAIMSKPFDLDDMARAVLDAGGLARA